MNKKQYAVFLVHSSERAAAELAHLTSFSCSLLPERGNINYKYIVSYYSIFMVNGNI